MTYLIRAADADKAVTMATRDTLEPALRKAEQFTQQMNCQVIVCKRVPKRSFDTGEILAYNLVTLQKYKKGKIVWSRLKNNVP